MLLGHSAFAEISFGNPRLDAIHNIAFTQTGSAGTFSIGTEVATGSAVFDLSGTDLQFTVSVGDETTLGESFQNLITFSTGSLNFFLWNEVDDAQSSTWKNVDPGSTD